KDGPIQNVDFYQAVSKNYFDVMGIRLMDGRVFDDRDVQGAPEVVVINTTMANTFWPKQNPIVRRIRVGGPNTSWQTVIGIVDDVKTAGLDRPAGTELYLSHAQPPGQGLGSMFVVARPLGGDPRSLVGAVREQAAELDSSVPVDRARLMDDVLLRAQARP